MFDNQRRKFQELKPEARQRLIICAIVAGLGIIGALTFFMTPFHNGRQAVSISAEPTKASIGLDNKILEKSVTAQLSDQGKRMDELSKQFAAVQTMVSAKNPGMALKPKPPTTLPPLGQAASAATQSLPGAAGTVSAPAQQTKMQRRSPPLPPLPVPPAEPLHASSPRHGDYRLSSPDSPKAAAVEKIGEIGAAENSAAKPGKGEGDREADTSKKKEKPAVYLPPSFMEATLLSGLNAPTTEGAKGNPVPVIIRIKAPAVLPNDVRANLKGCFVIAEGIGNLMDERAHLRLVSLSCISRKGQAVIDQDITGFVQDVDGGTGLAGRVVTKFGAHIARTMIAGFFGGLGDAANQSMASISVSPLGQTQTFDPSNLTSVGIAGLGRGVSTAAKEIQKFYLDLAHQTMPVIEVLNGKKITLIVTKGVNLEIKNYKPVPWH